MVELANALQLTKYAIVGYSHGSIEAAKVKLEMIFTALGSRRKKGRKWGRKGSGNVFGNVWGEIYLYIYMSMRMCVRVE